MADGPAPVTRHCSRCGQAGEAPDADGMPMGWSFGFDNGRVTYTCMECTRANVRSIEGKLPEEYWER